MTEEEINQTLDDVTGVLTEEPVKISVDINYRWKFQRILASWGVLPKVREFAIHPLCLGARMLISREVRKIPTFETESILAINHQLSDELTEAFARSIAIAFKNQPGKPSRAMVDFVLRNFDSDDLRKVFSIIIQQLNIQSFVSSTALMKGTGLLSPEIIAGIEETTDTSTPGQSPVV